MGSCSARKFSSEQAEELYDNELELAELLNAFVGFVYHLVRINLFSTVFAAFR